MASINPLTIYLIATNFRRLLKVLLNPNQVNAADNAHVKTATWSNSGGVYFRKKVIPGNKIEIEPINPYNDFSFLINSFTLNAFQLK